jgi:hypothetical protein
MAKWGLAALRLDAARLLDVPGPRTVGGSATTSRAGGGSKGVPDGAPVVIPDGVTGVASGRTGPYESRVSVSHVDG